MAASLSTAPAPIAAARPTLYRANFTGGPEIRVPAGFKLAFIPGDDAVDGEYQLLKAGPDGVMAPVGLSLQVGEGYYAVNLLEEKAGTLYFALSPTYTDQRSAWRRFAAEINKVTGRATH